MSREKALLVPEKARERIMKQKPAVQQDSLKPLPLEIKFGPLTNPDKNMFPGIVHVIKKNTCEASPRYMLCLYLISQPLKKII